MFKLFKKVDYLPPSGWYCVETEDGVRIGTQPTDLSRSLVAEFLGGFLGQLEDEGFAEVEDGHYFISWDTVYELMAHPEYSQSMSELELPAVESVLATINSHDSLEDATFDIAIGDWVINSSLAHEASLLGAVLTHHERRVLLPSSLWVLVREIRAFAHRDGSERTGHANRLGWGRIRRLAVAADVNLDSFLHRTVVLTPERLTIGIRKAILNDDTIIEVQPSFDGAPDDWLDRFDRQARVLGRYDIPTNEGIVQVVISPKVRTVLEEIKRLPMRRVAGARAQAFILNPYAALGEDANDVIDEMQFERARSEAGLEYERFLPRFERDAFGYPLKVGLLVETASALGPMSSDCIWLTDDELAMFVGSLKSALAKNYQLLGWNGYDLELQGDSPEYLHELEKALEDRKRPPIVITYAQIYDLTHYTSRVQEIGVEKPYFSPYIAKKKDDEGWFPENIIPIISWVAEGEADPISVQLSPQTLAEFPQKIADAKAAGNSEISIPGVAKPIPLAEAVRISETFIAAKSDADEGRLDPTSLKRPGSTSTVSRKSPVLLANIQNIDYAEERRDALSAQNCSLEMPSSMRSGYALLPHQREGVAWLQSLYLANRAYNCRGAVLADDMGLGKTLQLLTLMAWILEKDPESDPMLVVAPVSLLENWKEEATIFFTAEALPILIAYGQELAPLRVPRESIDERLRSEDGLTKFLKPGWLGDARIVLTTYETLRDLEFSFASQRWSLMICDEAQKIKNPAAMVTRAAKKQNVAFRIACTGTPVENTLADIWCLFDFVQPGLLGALNEFGRRYRKPIEARTNEELARVKELRELITPQILRRTKAEVAKDLPKKVIVEDCRKLRLSEKQRELYAWAVEIFKKRGEPYTNAPFKNHLGLLHYLRLVCTDPRRFGLDVFRPSILADYRIQAPKLDWLLSQLKVIKSKEEKVIVFCEFRVIQRLLQHYIHESLDFRPEIINGDTAASANHVDSRQKRIKSFQERVGFGVIILSPVAVGFGVNIQAANHVIHYTRTWNPAKEDQATDRAYRIGQKKDVYVYYPVVTADDFVTFDVKLDQLLEIKRELARDMLNGAGDLRPGDFNVEDVLPPGIAIPDLPVTLDTALSMKWQYLEALTAVLYTKRSYDAMLTPPSKDNGVDVVALPREGTYGKLVQVKASEREGETLSWSAVKDVVGGHAYYAKQYPGVTFQRVCLTNQRFDRQAHMNAALNEVELLEQPDLEKMLEATPVTLMDVEKLLYKEF